MLGLHNALALLQLMLVFVLKLIYLLKVSFSIVLLEIFRDMEFVCWGIGICFFVFGEVFFFVQNCFRKVKREIEEDDASSSPLNNSFFLSSRDWFIGFRRDFCRVR